MHRTAKAVKKTIHLGPIPIDVYKMPDDSYNLYVESVTAAVDRPNNDLLRFLNGKSLQALPYKDKNLLQRSLIEVEGYGGFIKPIPVELATAYWLFRATKGCHKAQLIAQACMAESIERRADVAFKFNRTEEEYNQKFGERLEAALRYNRDEVVDRRLPGDDLYLPDAVN